MSTENWLTLLGIATSVGTVAVGWLVVTVIALMVKVGRIEAVLSMMGKKALEALHSPHTPRFDALIEKFAAPDQTLTQDEWRELSRWVLSIEDDDLADDTKKALAHFVAALIKKNFLKPDVTPPDI